MSDMTDAQDSLAEGDADLELIERAGTAEITPAFVDAFNAMSPEDRQIWIEDATRNILTGEFGWAASFINDAELGPLFRKAVAERWSEAKFTRELIATDWYQSRTDSQREFDQLEQLKPADAQQQVDRASVGIRSVVSQYGGVLTDEQVAELARESVRSDWNENETLNAVAAEMMRGSDSGAIRFGITGEGVRQLASDYAVPLSDAALDEYAQQIATGKINQIDYENFLKNQAKSLYPTLTADIDRGVSVKTLTDPYRQVAASTLGISPETVDFSSDRWNAALNFDDGKGRRMMTLTEWGDMLRTDSRYGYEFTEDAQNKAYTIVEAIGQMFGRVA